MKTRTLLTFVAIALPGFMTPYLVAQNPFEAAPAASSPDDPFQAAPVDSFPRDAYAAPVGSYPTARAVLRPAIHADAQKIIARYETDKAAVQKKARKQIREARIALVASLEDLQNKYAHDAKLDEAIAVRNCSRELGKSKLQSMPDPGTLANFSSAKGGVFFFRVMGNSKMTVFGANPYTTDSGLASAAVHAGVLKLGRTAVVKVTILPGQNTYQGSARNGVTSKSFGYFPASFKVEAVSGDDEDAADTTPQPMPYAPPANYPPASPSGYNAPQYQPPRSYAPQPVATPANPVRSYPPNSSAYIASGAVEMPSTRVQYQVLAPERISTGSTVIISGVVPTPTVVPTPSIEELPADAKQLLERFRAESAVIEKSANREIAKLRRTAIADLKPLQDNLTRENKLDEAVVIRDCIRALKQTAANVLPDPGTLSPYPASVGSVFHFRVTGTRGGMIWGSDLYTSDSALATTAVHSGALKEGQTGVVKVTILPGQPSYQGTTRHGIASMTFGQYPTSYRVEPADDDDDDASVAEEKAKAEPPAAVAQGDKAQADELKKLRQEVLRLQRKLLEATEQIKQLRHEKQAPKAPAAEGNRR